MRTDPFGLLRVHSWRSRLRPTSRRLFTEDEGSRFYDRFYQGWFLSFFFSFLVRDCLLSVALSKHWPLFFWMRDFYPFFVIFDDFSLLNPSLHLYKGLRGPSVRRTIHKSNGWSVHPSSISKNHYKSWLLGSNIFQCAITGSSTRTA